MVWGTPAAPNKLCKADDTRTVWLRRGIPGALRAKRTVTEGLEAGCGQGPAVGPDWVCGLRPGQVHHVVHEIAADLVA